MDTIKYWLVGISLPDNTDSRIAVKKSEYAKQLKEKQKAKYTYGVLKKQFRNMFALAQRKKGITGAILIQLLECRLDNVVFRLGIAPTRAAARQLVNHKHIVVNGSVNRENGPRLLSIPEIDGLFVGRSAWEAKNFISLIRESLEHVGALKV